MLKTTTFAIAALGCLAAATPAQAGILGSFGATDPAGYTFTVPGGDTVFATATGGAGGSYPDPSFPFSGGLGGVASGAFAVTPGQRLSLVVAGRGQDGGQIPGTDGGCTIAAREGGYGNGGASGLSHTVRPNTACRIGGSGGGTSRVSFFGGVDLLVGGGGGGASTSGPGGDAGGLIGASGHDTGGLGDDQVATGGTQDAPGQPAQTRDCGCSYLPTAGGLRRGGMGGADFFLEGTGGAGGGAGFFGGGGSVFGGAGGGSSWTSPDTVVGGQVGDQVTTGNGSVTLEYGLADVPQFTASTPPHATAGAPFSYDLQASGWPAPAYSIAFGLLPPGITLDVNGTLSGTTTQAGTYFVDVQAANPRHATETLVKLVVDAAAPASITSPSGDQTAVGGAAFASTIGARVVDAYGNGVPGVNVHFALPKKSTAHFATGSTAASATSDAGGWADAGALNAGMTAGALPVTVSAAGLAPITVALTVLAGTLDVHGTLIAEGNKPGRTVKVMVTLDRTAKGPVTVAYATRNGTAIAGQDFVGTSGTLTLSATRSMAVIQLQVIGDRTPEPDETFGIVLSQPTGAAIGTGTADVTIMNDD